MAFNFPASPSIGQVYTSNGATFIWDGTKWKTVAVNVPSYAHGGIQLVRQDNSNLAVQPYGGNRLIVNGESRPVLAKVLPRGAAAHSNLYFVYAFWTGSALDYEFSTTGPALTTSGIHVRSDDATKTLVGMFFIISDTNVIEDGATRRCVSSWFNRRKKIIAVAINGATAQSGTPATIGGTAYGLAWPLDGLEASLSGYITTNATDHVFTSARINSIIGAEMGERVALGEYKTGAGYSALEVNVPTLCNFNAGLRTTGAATATLIGYVYSSIWG